MRCLRSLPLLAILALALWLRLHLDNSGESPWTFQRNDEVHYLSLATDFLQGRFRVDYFINPTFYAYLVWAVACLGGWVAVLAGRLESFADFRQAATLDPTGLLLVARSLSLVAGLLAVVLVYRIAKRVGGSGVGLVAALAMAVDRIHVERSHIGVNEAWMVLLVLLACERMLVYVEQPSRRTHLWAGIWLGLAASTKYNAGIHALTLLGASWLGLARMPGLGLRGRLLGWPGLLAAPLAFLAGSPGILLEPRAFWHEFRTQSSYLSEGFYVREKSWEVNGWRVYLERFPVENAGLCFALLSGLGILWLLWRTLRRRDAQARLLCLAILPTYLFLGSGTFLLMRFLLPAIPFVLIAGALALDALVAGALRIARVQRRSAAPWLRGGLALVLGASFVGAHARETADLHWREFGRPDRRIATALLLREWTEPGALYLDLVHPPIDRFFDDLARIRRYPLGESAGASPSQSLRWQRFQERALHTQRLADTALNLPDLASWRARIAAAGYSALILVLPTQRTPPGSPELTPEAAFADLPNALKKLPPRDPSLRRCAFYAELAAEIASLEPIHLALTANGSTLVAFLRLPAAEESRR